MARALLRFLLLACLACSNSRPGSPSNDATAGAAPLDGAAGAEAGGDGGAATGGSAGDGANGGVLNGASPGAGAESSAGGSPTEAAAGAAGNAPIEGCVRSRQVLVGQARNARDLGGVPLGDAARVRCGMLFRGAPLSASTPEGCSDVQALGVKTVLDLRTENERTYAPNASCLTAERAFAPLPIPYGLGPADYLNVLDTSASIAAAFHVFGNPDAYPIYFHCTYGRDRTGVVGALVLLTLGATREEVVQEYLLSQPIVGAFPDSLAAVLDEVELRGGAEAFLTSIGIGVEELAVLREQAVAAD